MRTILLVAAALIAAPALAQTAGAPTTAPGTATAADQTPTTTPDQATTTQQAPGQDMPATDANGQSAPMSQSMPMPQSTPTPGAPSTGGTMTAGGYQPSQPMPMANAGGQPVFTPGPSVDQAYPAPAPLASYPVCKKGQYDKCIQRGGK